MYIETFAVTMDKTVKETNRKMKKSVLGYWRMQRTQLSEFLYADDTVMKAEKEEVLQFNVNVLNETSSNINMKTTESETKSMIM